MTELIPFPPVFSDATARYWDFAKSGQLALLYCDACGRPHQYPRPRCPHCRGKALTWQAVCGRGTLESFSTLSCNGLDPSSLILAVVRLVEGPTMLSWIVETPAETLRVGQRLAVAFRGATDGTAVPVFKVLQA